MSTSLLVPAPLIWAEGSDKSNFTFALNFQQNQRGNPHHHGNVSFKPMNAAPVFIPSCLMEEHPLGSRQGLLQLLTLFFSFLTALKCGGIKLVLFIFQQSDSDQEPFERVNSH